MSQDLHAKEEKSVLGRVVTRGLLALACILVLMAGSCPGEASGGGTVTVGATSDGIVYDIWWEGGFGSDFTGEYLLTGTAFPPGDYLWIALIRFGPTAIAEVPSDATIISANLTLTEYIYDSPPADDTLRIDIIKEDWDEGTINYDTANDEVDFVDVNFTTYNVTTTDGENTFDVTDVVQAWISSEPTANHGIRLKKETAGGYNYEYFYSSEHGTASERPKLTIEY